MRIFSTYIHQNNNEVMADNLYEDSLNILDKVKEDNKRYENGKTTFYHEKQEINLEVRWCHLKDYILTEAHKYLRFLKSNDYKLKIHQIWLSEMNKGGNHPLHVHVGSILSGTFYIHVPENSGQIEFQRHEWMSDPFERIKFTEYNEYNADIWKFEPKKGDLYIWKSDLPHLVEKNNSDSRISVSFNIGIDNERT